ncbi:hypothetical protein [Catenuloplanes japonicus]|uniref:hypothetical protein n=1 Tax=Catenuloplanes japonicus TaxID=33876 RepID=UPI0005256591|nr:hypothetical protein [Catenuloplanes japonicus]
MRFLRWITVIGALLAVTLFGGASSGDDQLTPSSLTACPNVVLQAALLGGQDRTEPVGDHGVAVTDAGLFVVIALGVALLGALRGPLLTDVSFRGRGPALHLQWLTAVLPIRTDSLRI